MARVIAIANPKGGVGKTSLTLGMGAALSRLNHRVLLVDMDGAAALTYGLIGEDAGDLEGSMYDVLTGAAPAEDLIIKTDRGPALLPSSLSLDNLETDRIEGKSFLLREALKTQRKKFDYILIDTPPRLGSLSLNAFIAAQEVYAAVLADILSYRSLLSMRDTIEEIARRYGKGPKLEGIIINFYDGRRNLEKFIREKILREYRAICFKTTVRRSVGVPESIMTGTDVFKYAAWKHVAADFMSLAKEIIKRGE